MQQLKQLKTYQKAITLHLVSKALLRDAKRRDLGVVTLGSPEMGGFPLAALQNQPTKMGFQRKMTSCVVLCYSLLCFKEENKPKTPPSPSTPFPAMPLVASGRLIQNPEASGPFLRAACHACTLAGSCRAPLTYRLHAGKGPCGTHPEKGCCSKSRS